MKLASPPPQRNRGATARLSSGRERDRDSKTVYEAQPLVTEDEELFLEGDLNAAEYLSRVTSDASAEQYRGTSYQRTELVLSVLLAVAGLAFFGTALKLFFSNGGDVALLGLLMSSFVMLLVQLILELRRRRRHQTTLNGQGL